MKQSLEGTLTSNLLEIMLADKDVICAGKGTIKWGQDC